MPLADASPSYRAYLNRNRVVYFLPGQPHQTEALSAAFADQGFICTTLGSAAALDEMIDRQRPDVVLMDISHARLDPRLITSLRSRAFGVRVFLLAGANPEASEVVRAVRAGAVAVFVRPFQATQILQAVSDELREDLRVSEGTSLTIQGLSSLTEREREVLRHVVAGRTNREAAEELGISPRTIEVHRAAAMRKLGARNTAEMIRIALKS